MNDDRTNARPSRDARILDRTSDFFNFGDVTYLNCAYHGPLPRVADEALAAAASLRRNPATIHVEDHFAFPEAYRRAIASVLGTEPSTLSITDSATRGLMLLATGLDWSAGDEVVIPRNEFPSNRLPWLSLARRGVRLREVDACGPRAVEQLMKSVNARTRLVSVSWVRFLDGFRIDLEALSKQCRRRGVLLAVDGSQGIGAVPLDLMRAPVDLLACAGYKWLLGPYGVGFVHVAPTLQDRLDPPDHVNWLAARGAHDFSKLVDLPCRFDPGPQRWDANETANFFNIAAATAAARYVASVTPAAIHAHCRALLAHLDARLPSGYSLIDHQPDEAASSFGCFRGPTPEATRQAHQRLIAGGVMVSAREGAIRVSPHVYNTAGDIDRLLELLSSDRITRPRPKKRDAAYDPHAVLHRLMDLRDAQA